MIVSGCATLCSWHFTSCKTSVSEHARLYISHFILIRRHRKCGDVFPDRIHIWHFVLIRPQNIGWQFSEELHFIFDILFSVGHRKFGFRAGNTLQINSLFLLRSVNKIVMLHQDLYKAWKHILLLNLKLEFSNTMWIFEICCFLSKIFLHYVWIILICMAVQCACLTPPE